MALIDTIPLIGALIAVLLGIIILTNKTQSKAARITLSVVVFLNAHNLLESYLYYNNLVWPGLGLSYLHYHLVGPLFLLYTYLLFRIEINLKLWGGVLLGFTLLRLVVLEPVGEDIFETSTLTPELIGLIADNFLSILLNVGFLVLAYLKIRGVRFAVDLTKKEQLNFRWLKNLLFISIVLYFAILTNSVFSFFDAEQWMIYLKAESALTSLFSLFIAYSTMRFPIFSVYGDFRDLPNQTRKKYAKSSLTDDESDKIWEALNSVMNVEKLYRNPECRLNDLASRVDKSVHHVSQVINEKQGISFSDFVNQFRVKDAKELLSSPRAKQITILAISLEAGFNSKTTFYNTFKKVTGQTPSDFMRNQKTDASSLSG